MQRTKNLSQLDHWHTTQHPCFGHGHARGHGHEKKGVTRASGTHPHSHISYGRSTPILSRPLSVTSQMSSGMLP